MGLQHLADVHARGHAERVEHDVDGGAVGGERHVLDRQDHGDHALVAVAAGHLVARLDAALDGQVDLDHLQHARRQVVAGGDLAALVFQALLELLAQGLELFGDLLEIGVGLLVAQADLEPLVTADIGQVVLGDLAAGGQLLRAALGDLAGEQGSDTLVDVVFHDAQLVVEVLADRGHLLFLDLQGARVLLHPVAGEHLHVDDRAVHAGRHAQRGVLHVGGLLAEDGAQQLLLGGQLGLALRRDLADQDVARLHLGADIDDAGLVQLGQRTLADVRDIAGDLLRAELGVARDARQFLDVDGGEAVFLDHALRDQDGVLEVVAVPRHERDQQVLAQCQFAQVGGRSVGQHVATRNHVTQADQRALVDAGVLVGAACTWSGCRYPRPARRPRSRHR